jgi:hypothetical protein
MGCGEWIWLREAVNTVLKCIVYRGALPKDALGELGPEEREKLVKMDEDIRVAMERNRSDAAKMSEESVQVAKERANVLKQLSVLSNLLADPSSIDRVEAYDNPFASGNFELLKKLSVYLRTLQKR